MKAYRRMIIWWFVLVTTAFVCIFSARFNRAAHSSSLLENCEVPITFSGIAQIAISPPSENACINNLRQIDGAKQEWALENHKTNADEIVTWKDITPYLGTRGGTRVWCPQGGVYRIEPLGKPPTCSCPGHALN